MGDIWLKTFVPASEFDRLYEFLTENGNFIRTEHMQSVWYDAQGHFAIEQHDGYCLIHKSSGGEIPEVVDVRAKYEDYENLQELFSELDFSVSCRWKMQRFLFDWFPVMVYLEKWDGFGVVVELKLYAQLKVKDETIAEAKEKFTKMGISLMDKVEFDSIKNSYISKWKNAEKL